MKITRQMKRKMQRDYIKRQLQVSKKRQKLLNTMGVPTKRSGIPKGGNVLGIPIYHITGEEDGTPKDLLTFQRGLRDFREAVHVADLELPPRVIFIVVHPKHPYEDDEACEKSITTIFSKSSPHNHYIVLFAEWAEGEEAIDAAGRKVFEDYMEENQMAVLDKSNELVDHYWEVHAQGGTHG
ncbi:MAG: hypothetical protein F4118_00335 [Acidimicrobiaceae bacterium]|nr:hypothetical protein [Candidatus Poribacteria bacterium]MYI34869.1 hypothetical protein [Acidimicrobiaceae bacterium]